MGIFSISARKYFLILSELLQPTSRAFYASGEFKIFYKKRRNIWCRRFAKRNNGWSHWILWNIDQLILIDIISQWLVSMRFESSLVQGIKLFWSRICGKRYYKKKLIPNLCLCNFAFFFRSEQILLPLALDLFQIISYSAAR